MQNKIVISSNISDALATIKGALDPNSIRVFEPEKEEFLVSDAALVIEEAYIAESSNKYIIIAANTFSVVVQNKLLKILEEPPRNIIFIIIVPSKNTLLPTIRSRLPLEFIKTYKEKHELGLDLRRLDINDIYEYIKSIQGRSKSEVKEIIQTLFTESIASGLRYTEEEMEMFEQSISLCELNANKQNLVTNLLLIIYRKRG